VQHEAAMADAAPTEALIDVKALIASLSNADHAARADAYFANIPDPPKLLRKPFHGIVETRANLHGAGEILQLLRLFRGAKVLDFGAGTGWFSRMLACIECEPVAVDVSARALEMGRLAFEQDPLMAGLTIDWRHYDGLTLPLDDESVDRIVCYDSFHHVADQAATLREFHRVLVPGGRIAFHEPGPHHSKIPVSQYEMRHHGVIENDIVVEDIWAQAQALRGIEEAANSLRIFAMAKGEDVRDSRTTDGLAGTLAVEVTRNDGKTLRGRIRVANTGTTLWRPSRNETGGVRIGVKLLEAAPDEGDYGRVFLSATPVLPGQLLDVEFTLPVPRIRPATLCFDLVAEFVTWFETLGTKPAIIRFD
jgi:ubiquinone/menaquinone biosynthesis C-methylase UbiE